MKPYTLLLAFGGLDDVTAEETMRFLLPADRTLRRHGRLLRTILLAATLTLLLAACGYMAYRATMSHREPSPSDEMRYYLKREVGGDLTLNMGTCALALQFDTEETGTAHAFRMGTDSGLDPGWELGAFCPTYLQFLNAFTPETNERMADFPEIEPLPDDQIRTLEQGLRESGLTEEEADTWLTTAAWFGREDGQDALKLRIDLYNGPWLHGIDLICGWPEGEAEYLERIPATGGRGKSDLEGRGDGDCQLPLPFSSGAAVPAGADGPPGGDGLCRTGKSCGGRRSAGHGLYLPPSRPGHQLVGAGLCLRLRHKERLKGRSLCYNILLSAQPEARVW